MSAATQDLGAVAAREFVRQMLIRSAAICLKAGEHAGAKRLLGTTVDPASRFACVIRSVRIVETAIVVTWSLEVVEKRTSRPAGLAVEALQLTKAACTAWLNAEDLNWMDYLARRIAKLEADSRGPG